MRVTPDCEPLDSAFFIAQAAERQWQPDIAFNNGQYLAVWSDGRSGVDRIFGSRLTPAGSILDPGGLAIGPDEVCYQGAPQVVPAGDKFTVVWANSTEPCRIFSRQVDAGGNLGDTAIIAEPAGTLRDIMAMEASGSNILVVWVEMSGEVVFDVKGRILSLEGIPAGSTFTIAAGLTYNSNYPIGLCYDGANFLATYSYCGTIYGRKIDTGGNLLGAQFRISNTGSNQYYTDVVAGANNRYFNVWDEFDGADFDLKGNLDVPITGVAEAKSAPAGELRLRSRIVRDAIVLENAGSIEAVVFDVAGKKIGKMKNGYFNCRDLVKGVYFIKVPAQGKEFKVIKI